MSLSRLWSPFRFSSSSSHPPALVPLAPLRPPTDPDASEDFAQTFRPNISGPYFLTSALVPLLRAAPSPSVIIVSSIAAVANQRPVSSLTYGVSKAALCHLGTMLAGRLIP